MRVLFFFWVVQGFAAFNLTWGIPTVNLDSDLPPGDTDENAALAIDPMGNAVATWGRTIGKGASEDIWAAVYNHSLRVWTSAVKVSGGGNSSNSQVTVDNEGNALIVWEEGFPTQIRSRTLSAEGVWTPDLSLPPAFVQSSKNAQTSPQVAIDADGNAVAIWMEFVKPAYHIHSAKKSFEAPWIGLGEISSGRHSAALVSPKSLAINGMGDAIAVWQEANGPFSEIHGAQFINEVWQPPLAIAAEEQKMAQFPAAGIDDAGNAVIVWSQDNAILSKRLIDGTLSDAPLVISNHGYVSLRPDVGVDAAGNAVAVFERYDALHKFIAGSTLSAKDNTWSAPVDISGPSHCMADAVGYPVLSFNAIGDGVVIWKEHNETNMIIQAAGYSLGTWSPIKTLSSLNDRSGTFIPTMAVSVNVVGNIMAVWPEDPEGTGDLQIVATAGVGLANVGPLPPRADPATVEYGIASGVQIAHKFPAHLDLINVLSWSPAEGAAHYNIYRNKLTSHIGTSASPSYEDHQRVPKEHVTYLITAVDKNGQESGPMTLVVKPR